MELVVTLCTMVIALFALGCYIWIDYYITNTAYCIIMIQYAVLLCNTITILSFGRTNKNIYL